MNKKTFIGPELAQAILNGEFKEGTKFATNDKRKYSVWKNNEEKFVLLPFPINMHYTTDLMVLAYDTFTLIKEPTPELFYFNQVKSNGKKIRVKGWDKFYTLREALKILADYDSVVINEAFNKKVWEVEE